MPGLSPLDELRAAAKLTGPKMPPRVSPEEASANAGMLRSSSSDLNFSPRAPTAPSPLTVTSEPFGPNMSQRGTPGSQSVTLSGGSLGGDPFWGDSAASQMHRGDVSAEQGRAHQLAGLQQAFEESQRQGDVLEQKSDADLFSGLTGRRFAGQATAQNAGLNIASEGAAGRQFAPNAQMLHTRDLADQLAQIKAKYAAEQEIAMTKGGYDVEAAKARASGPVLAANAHESTAPQRAFSAAYNEYIAKTGKLPDETTLGLMKATFGIK